MKEFKCEKITSTVFIIIIFSFLAFNFKSVLLNAYRSYESGSIKETIESFQEKQNDLMTKNRIWIDIFGLTQRILLKKEVKNFEILKDKSGQLHREGSEKGDVKSIKNKFLTTKELYDLSKEKEIPFIFVQVPFKNFGNKPELYNYGDDFRDYNYDLFLDFIKLSKIPYLDLRETLDSIEFYKTDHHWTVETAFDASVNIIKKLDKLNRGSLVDENQDQLDKKNYDNLTWKNSFIGSIGIRVGEYFAGKDDFTILVPTFETDLVYKHYIKNKLTKEKHGDFISAFIDKNLVSDENYNNKYNACLYGGYAENIILNNNAKNDSKVLFISHSYGRPLVQYLSLNFKETRYLDPQEGRYNGNYLDYVESYEPDYIIVMYNGGINTH